ncbi:MAG: LysM peptidoglycan-binding domain-containing protein [Anaerolineaceae bacterium]|nr:LysM peptidoglycan-binding domain-containing protein [Anaerolineaceae bacterium]
MIKLAKTWQLTMGCLMLVAALAGCFQPADEVLSGTAVAGSVPSPTWTPIPSLTNTPEDTATPEQDTLIVIETATPSPSPDAAIDLIAESSTEVAQEPVLESWELTATQIVATVTLGYEQMLTQTAIGSGIGIPPTATPTGISVIPEQPINTPIPGGSCVHQVVAGENLFRLSLRYGVSIADIAAANGISNIQLITVDQRLTIPGCGTTGVYPPPTTTSGLVVANPGTGTGTVGTGTSTCPGTYTVQQYDTLFQISLRCGVPVQSIANANGISNINLIIMSNTLVIPSQ